ncbi:MAG: hypothetical protein RQ714_07690, partial [Nitrosomonas sp.]|nr:hypothetical protein [Nitrosomonas sp.]
RDLYQQVTPLPSPLSYTRNDHSSAPDRDESNVAGNMEFAVTRDGNASTALPDSIRSFAMMTPSMHNLR